MRRNSVYIAFILGGAMVGERVSRGGRERGGGQKKTLAPRAPPCPLSRKTSSTLTTSLSLSLPFPPQAVDYAINSAWKSNNKGKLYEDCVAAGTIGGAVGEEE